MHQKTRGLILALLALASLAQATGRAYVASALSPSAQADLRPKFPKAGETLLLYAVLERGGATLSEAPALSLAASKARGLRRWEKALDGPAQIRWYKVEPELTHPAGKGHDPDAPDFLWYANAHVPHCPRNRGWIGFDRIEYRETELKGMRDRWSIPADAHPSRPEEDLHEGLGVMRYRVEIRLDRSYSSPGLEARRHDGIAPEVHWLAFRKDDSLEGWMSSYFNVPGVFGSSPRQAEDYVGIDCADLIVAAQARRSGRKLPFTNVANLLQRLKPALKEAYLHPDGSISAGPLSPARLSPAFGAEIKTGDVIFFDYPNSAKQNPYGSWDHVGVLFEDKGPVGALEAGDLVLHTGPAEPHLSRLNDPGFVQGGPTKISIRRFP